MMPAREGTGSHPVRTVGGVDEREPGGPTKRRRTPAERRIAATVIVVAIGLLVLAFVLAAIAVGSTGGTVG